jgi:hypothetical protein
LRCFKEQLDRAELRVQGDAVSSKLGDRAGETFDLVKSSKMNQ